MRKPLLVIIAILTILLLQGNSIPTLDGVLLKNSSVYNSMKLNSGLYLKNIILLPDVSNYDQVEAKKIIKRLDQLPPQLLRKVLNVGIKIKLFQGKLTDNPSAAYLKGLTPRGYSNHSITWDQVPGIGGSKTVLVKIGFSEKGKDHGSINLELHELAHSIDRYLYHSTDGKIFNSFWEKESRSLFPGQTYFIHFPEEYFAESFAMYYYNDESKIKLMKKAPKTFAYISRHK